MQWLIVLEGRGINRTRWGQWPIKSPVLMGFGLDAWLHTEAASLQSSLGYGIVGAL